VKKTCVKKNRVEKTCASRNPIRNPRRWLKPTDLTGPLILCPRAFRLPAQGFREGVHYAAVELLACSRNNLLLDLCRR